MFTQKQIPVLIVGGGIVGLTAALFLLQQDIPFVLIERHSGPSIHPRARGFHFRTMELFRELGLEEIVRTAGAKLARSQGFIQGENLLQALSTAQDPFILPTATAPTIDLHTISPCVFSRCTQDILEPMLRDTIRQRGGTLYYDTELIALDQDEEGVTATIVERSTGKADHIQAKYAIAADGAKSSIRSLAGVTMGGRGTLGHQINIYFQADLRAYVQSHEFSMCMIRNAQASGLLTAINNEDRWTFHTSYFPEQGEKPQDFTPERCSAMLRTILGLPHIETHILSILPWEAASRVAHRFQIGKRIFLVGDAAHQMPPTGGFGASTGIQDAHNLVWKLAAVLRQQADASLLQTYEAERRPVACFTAEQAAIRSDRFATLNNKQGYVDDLVVIGGYQYASQAIFSEREAFSPPDTLELDGRPGTRAPHIWLQRQHHTISTLDLFGRHFVLLTGTEGTIWRTAATSVAQQAHIDIDVHLISSGGELQDSEQRWLQAYGITDAGAVLIRPDGFVAWRTDSIGQDPQRVLEHVFTTILHNNFVESPLERDEIPEKISDKD